MPQTLDFDKLYEEVLDEAVKYFAHSAKRLQDGSKDALPSADVEALKSYLESDAAKNNPELKAHVTAALRGGLERLHISGNDYRTGDKASLVYLSGALGAFTHLNNPAITPEVKTLENSIVSDFAEFKKTFANKKFSDELHFRDSYYRIRPLCSGIDAVLKRLGEQLGVRTVIDNMLNRLPEPGDEKTKTPLRERIGRNPGGVKIIALALTPQEAAALHNDPTTKIQAAESASAFAKNFQANLAHISDHLPADQALSLSLYDKEGNTLYRADKEHPQPHIDAEKLRKWYTACGVNLETQLGNGEAISQSLRRT